MNLFVSLFNTFESSYQDKIAYLIAFTIFAGIVLQLLKRLDRQLGLAKRLVHLKKFAPLAGGSLIILSMAVILNIAFPYAFVLAAAVFISLLLIYKNDKKR